MPSAQTPRTVKFSVGLHADPHNAFCIGEADMSLRPLFFLLFLLPAKDILRERPSSPSPKAYAVSYMSQHTCSFAYTREVLRTLTAQARAEVARLGGNAGVEAILDRLVVKDGEEPVLETTAAATAAAATGVKGGGPRIGSHSGSSSAAVAGEPEHGR